MATLKIETVKTKTKGGYDAEITGIDPTDTDCLRGTINTPAKGMENGKWNLGGICRDKADECNIIPNSEEITDVIDTAKRLGCK
ncbi:hypothetical protein [Roseospira navarrensis]|uniref:Uncharacterized protein n=1 Tax=Roseospira navarrensis TaxID=140058 RepID=A0A7X1ZHI8_9PROT|nr:hypothetical protein [Roseospira navarrensis]MQX38624.1 hypothetical protein [Roseospira navarrensis]